MRSNLEVFSHASTLTAHAWMQFAQGPAGSYLFRDICGGGAADRRSRALMELMNAFRLVLNGVSPATSDNREQIHKIKLTVLETICFLETVLPKSELAPMLHILMHVPESMHRWKS